MKLLWQRDLFVKGVCDLKMLNSSKRINIKQIHKYGYLKCIIALTTVCNFVIYGALHSVSLVIYINTKIQLCNIQSRSDNYRSLMAYWHFTKI